MNGVSCDCLRFRIIPCCQTTDPPFRYFQDIDFEAEANVNHVRNEFDTTNNLRRKNLYRIVFCASLDFGYKLAERERRALPTCDEAKIRQSHPEESGLYMGFKEA